MPRNKKILNRDHISESEKNDWFDIIYSIPIYYILNHIQRVASDHIGKWTLHGELLGGERGKTKVKQTFRI